MIAQGFFILGYLQEKIFAGTNISSEAAAADQ